MHILLKLLLHSLWVLILLLVIAYTIRSLFGLLHKFPGGYGRLLRPLDCMFDEDSSQSIISTFEMDGDLKLDHVRQIFVDRVLRAIIGKPKSERLRYPEFQQYVTKAFGFLIWKDEENFDITEHIFEEEAESHLLDMGNLHQTLINRRFQDNKSPWELILIRNVIPVDQGTEPNEKQEAKSVLAFRMHHIMSDGKSVIKLFVECVGGKPLIAAEAHEQKMSLIKRVFLPILIPAFLLWEVVKLTILSWTHPHPWKVSCKDKSMFVVKFSKPLNIKDIKAVATENGVTLSAVLISLISGAMERFRKTLTENGTMMAYILPMENHPNVLANHLRSGVDLFPTNLESQSASLSDRLRCYDSSLQSIRQLDRCLPVAAFANIAGSLPRCRLQKALYCNYYAAVLVTNIAGDKEGFSIGEVWCSGHRLSATAPRGKTGALFCIFSYQNQLRIALVGKESVISETESTNVVNLIGMEYDSLKCLGKDTGTQQNE